MNGFVSHGTRTTDQDAQVCRAWEDPVAGSRPDKHGLVARAWSLADGRATDVFLTDAGADLVECLGEFTDLTSEVRFTATLTNTTSGETVFSFAPEDINFRNRVHNGSNLLDAAPASYEITSTLLNDTDQYQLVISQYAGSYNSPATPPVPEPSQWAMLGAGLGLLALARRRRG